MDETAGTGICPRVQGAPRPDSTFIFIQLAEEKIRKWSHLAETLGRLSNLLVTSGQSEEQPEWMAASNSAPKENGANRGWNALRYQALATLHIQGRIAGA